MDIAVVGSDEFVVGFRLAGIRKVYGVSPDELPQTIEALMADESVGLLAVHTRDLEELPQQLRDKMTEPGLQWTEYQRSLERFLYLAPLAEKRSVAGPVDDESHPRARQQTLF